MKNTVVDFVNFFVVVVKYVKPRQKRRQFKKALQSVISLIQKILFVTLGQ